MSNNICITEYDYTKLKDMLSSQDGEFDHLELEIDRAKIIPKSEAIPKDLIVMGSKIKFINLETNKEMITTLVYPHEANFSEGKLSILASLGSALLGLRANQEIDWEFPDGSVKKIKILEVLSQPIQTE